MSGKVVFIIALLSVLVIQSTVWAQNGNSQLAQQVIAESNRLGLTIDQSKIDTTFLNNDGTIAFISLITDSTLKVTSQQIKEGTVYTTLQCMTSKKLNGCYRVRVTDLLNEGNDLALSLVDAGGNNAATTQVSSIDKHQVIQSTIVMVRGPMDFYIDGRNFGKFPWVIIYIP